MRIHYRIQFKFFLTAGCSLSGMFHGFKYYSYTNITKTTSSVQVSVANSKQNIDPSNPNIMDYISRNIIYDVNRTIMTGHQNDRDVGTATSRHQRDYDLFVLIFFDLILPSPVVSKVIIILFYLSCPTQILLTDLSKHISHPI